MTNAYEKVQALKKKHPEMSMTDLIEKAGTTASAYYYHHAKMAKTGAGKRQKRKYQRIEIPAEPAPRAAGQMTMIIGSPEQLREVLGGIV